MTTLRDLLLDSRDGEWGKEKPFEQSVHMQAIRGTDFEDVRVGNTSSVPARYLADRHATRKKLQKWDIVFETAGGSKDRPTGRSVFLTPSRMAHFELPVTCASFARFLRIDPEKADPEFVFWLLQDMYERRELLRFHTQHTGVARFQFTTFADTWPLNLPPRPVQRRIADLLSAYDDLVENNTRRIAILEDMARRLFEQWFGQHCIPPVADHRAELPDGWSAATLSDWVIDLRDAVDPNSLDPATTYVGLEHLPRRSTTLRDWGTASDVGSTKLKYRPGDILFGKIRPYFHKVAVMPAEGVCSSDAIVMRPKTVEHLPMAIGLTSSDAFVAHATQTSNGTKMPRADWKVLKE